MILAASLIIGNLYLAPTWRIDRPPAPSLMHAPCRLDQSLHDPDVRRHLMVALNERSIA